MDIFGMNICIAEKKKIQPYCVVLLLMFVSNFQEIGKDLLLIEIRKLCHVNYQARLFHFSFNFVIVIKNDII